MRKLLALALVLLGPSALAQAVPPPVPSTCEWRIASADQPGSYPKFLVTLTVEFRYLQADPVPFRVTTVLVDPVMTIPQLEARMREECRDQLEAQRAYRRAVIAIRDTTASPPGVVGRTKQETGL